MQAFLPARAVLAAVALFAVGAAHAVSTETTAFGGFSIGLTDLDPSDGISPSATLDPQSTSAVFAGAGTSFGNPVVGWPQQGASAFGAVSTSGDVAGTGGSAFFAGDPFDAGVDISASAHGGPSLDVGMASAFVETPSGYNLLTLSPHTELTLGGMVELDWSASNPLAAAYGEADLDLFLLDSAGQDFVGFQYATGGYYGDGNGPLAGSAPPTPLWVAYDNDSDQPVEVGYFVAVFASASELETVLPPVDEPASGGLLLAGVAALLWGVQRRR